MIEEIQAIQDFNPLTDDSKTLPNHPGIYIICAKNLDALPITMSALKYCYLNEMPIIYVGISKISLRGRDYGAHFKGKSEKSTLRRSLGSLFCLEKELLTRKGKYRFIQKHEEWLSSWMKENLFLFWKTPPLKDIDDIEQKLINYFNPPLNIKGNKNKENAIFRKMLTDKRKLKPL